MGEREPRKPCWSDEAIVEAYRLLLAWAREPADQNAAEQQPGEDQDAAASEPSRRRRASRRAG
jgi:hypothetical protein